MNTLKATTLITLLTVALSAGAQDQAAPPNSLTVGDTGNVGVGVANPLAKLHVQAVSTAQVFVQNTNTTTTERVLFKLQNKGKTRFEIVNGAQSWTFDNDGTAFNISKVGTGKNELRLTQSGDLFLQGALFQNSSRQSKEAIEAVDAEQILQKVITLPLASWQYRDGDGNRHLGPMAEDFHAAFGLGESERTLATLDTAGVALAAIQGLHRQVSEREARIAELEAQLQAQQAQIDALTQQQGQMQALAARLETLLLGAAQAAR